MKAFYTFAATALFACVAATPHNGHGAYHKQLKAPILEQKHGNASCECTTSYTTFYGEATRVHAQSIRYEEYLTNIQYSDPKYTAKYHHDPTYSYHADSHHRSASTGDQCFQRGASGCHISPNTRTIYVQPPH